ncbi:Phage-related minor tail protein [Chelatococcus sambhunathii]|uniref:Phage-related minor tail protein n=1 Tax=Chelatococcus sambhunathii TaxID=363953 RepID=A0ABP2A8Q4_9HYPH|nr:phage tail tape measure protein [Chelatococcus sambhunathii]CUA90921.1 Phage-related minor tail protein [Chelatococcus sambhunathii]
MAIILEAEAVFRARDASGKALADIANRFKEISKAGKTVGEAVSGIGRQIGEMKGKLDRIEGFRGLQRGLSETRQKFRAAQEEVQRLSRAMREVEQPTRQMEAAYRRAQAAVSSAAAAYRDQARAAIEAKRGLEQAGIPLNNLRGQQDALKRSIEAANNQLQRQAQIMARGGPWGRGPVSGSGVPLTPQTHPAQSQRPMARAGSAAATVAGTAAAYGGGMAFRSAYTRMIEFERSVAYSQARGELTDEQATRLRRNARELGAAGLGFSARDVSELQRAYVQAGYENDADALARPTMNFSLFGDVDPYSAADFTVSALAAYGIKPKNREELVNAATRYQDIIAKGANVTRLGVDDFAQGFKYAAPFAAALGVSQEQLAAMIATQGQAGLRGDEAGVAVRSMLTRTVKPTADSRQAMAEMGMRFEDYALETKPVSVDDLLSGLRNQGIDASKIRKRLQRRLTSTESEGGDIAEAMTDEVISGLGIKSIIDKRKVARMVSRYTASLGERLDVDRLLADLRERGVTPGQMSRIFDQRQGVRIGTLTFNDDYERFLKILTEQSAGSSERGAELMRRGPLGAHNRLVSSFDNLILSLAESGVLDTVATGLDAVATTFRSMAETNPKLLEFSTYAAMAVGGIGALTLAIRPLVALVGALGGGGAAAAGASAVGAAAAGSRLGTFVNMGLKGGLIGGGLYFGGKALINAAVDALPKPAYPAGYDPEAEMNLGTWGRIKRIWNDLPSLPSGPAVDPATMERARRAADEFRRDPEGARGRAMMRMGPAQMSVTGEATVRSELKVQVEPSPLFEVRMREIAREQAARMPLQGSTNGPGSTGVSMPEAAAPIVGSGRE